MSDIRRFDIVSFGERTIDHNPEGEYVTHADHAAVVARLTKRLDAAEKLAEYARLESQMSDINRQRDPCRRLEIFRNEIGVRPGGVQFRLTEKRNEALAMWDAAKETP